MKPNTVIGTFSGVGAAELLISSQYLDYEVRYSGPTSGIMTLRAKHDNGAVFESVNNGKVDLSISKTIRIQGYQLDAIVSIARALMSSV